MNSSEQTPRPAPASDARRRTDALLLAAALAVPIFGALMSADTGGHVYLPGLAGAPLPPLCPSRWFGLRCPTCGVTRSIIALMHGDLAGSLAAHRFGWLMLLLILSQIPYRVDRLLRPAVRLPRLELAGIAALMAVAVTVVANRFAEVFMGL